MNYPNNPWHLLKRRALGNNETASIVQSMNSWLLVDDYLPATTVVGTLATEKGLEIADDFMRETEWPNLIVWPFRSFDDKENFENNLNDYLHSIMSDRFIRLNNGSDTSSSFVTSSSSRLQYFIADLFQYEKQVDIQVGEYYWRGYAIGEPVGRYLGQARWVKVELDGPVRLDALFAIHDILEERYLQAKGISNPIMRSKWLRRAGGIYVRTMGRLSFVRKAFRLGILLHRLMHQSS
jgi:hypothetical protein